MRNIIVALIIIVGASSCYDAMTKNTSKAAQYQKDLIAFYENPSSSPLKGLEKDAFKGLTFFPLSKEYIVDGRFAPIANSKTIPFPTSANKIKRYKEYGTISFTIDNQEQQLTVYTPEPMMDDEPDYLFIPFKDATSGKTSYGAGRYIEIKMGDIKQGNVVLDFNMAYNPYCAYSESYNCPIPPETNFLTVSINAGASYTSQ